MDETQLERLVISLEANTAKLDSQMVKSSALLDKQLSAMESRTQTWAGRMEKSLGGAGSNAGKLFSATLKQGTADARSYASSLGPLGSILATVGGGWLAAGAAAGGFAYLLEQGTEKLAAQDRALAEVQAVLNATDHASGQTADSIEQMAERISGSTLQTKQDVIEAAAELATFGNIGPQAFEAVLRDAAGMSQLFGGSLLENVRKIGKALQDPVAGAVSLRRVIGELTPAQTEAIANFVKMGDTAKAQQVVLEAFAAKGIGAAGGAGHTGLIGATHDLSEAWNRLLIDFAGSSGSTGIAQKAIDAVTGAVNALDGAIKNAGGVMAFMAQMAAIGHGGAIPHAAAPPAAWSGIAPNEGPFKGLPATYEDYEAKTGPAREAARALAGLTAKVNEAGAAFKKEVDERKQSPLQQAIDAALKQTSSKAGIDVSEYGPGGKFAAQGAQVRQLAIEEYNLSEARKDGKKAAEEAKEAEKKALEGLSETAKQTIEAFKLIDELNDKLGGAANRPGAERKAYVSEQVARLPEGQQYLSGDVSSAAGAAFDAKTLEEQVTKGQDLVRNYQDQVTALQADKAAAEAAKFEHDALVEIYQKTGTVSDAAAAAIHNQAMQIAAAGHAAEQATELYKQQVEVSDELREGLTRIGEAGLTGFHGMRDAAREFLQQLAELIIKLYVMGPLLTALLGKQGTAGGGVLGGGLQALLGGSSAPATEDISMSVPVGSTLADYGSSSGGIASIFSSIGDFFGFSAGGRVQGAGGSRSDNVLARVSPGEFVVQAGPASRNASLLHAINAGADIPAFASGGMVGSRSFSLPRLPAVPRTAGGLQVHAPIQIDARGAQEGVAEQIARAAPDIVSAAVSTALKHVDYMFPKKLNDTLRDRG